MISWVVDLLASNDRLCLDQAKDGLQPSKWLLCSLVKSHLLQLNDQFYLQDSDFAAMNPQALQKDAQSSAAPGSLVEEQNDIAHLQVLLLEACA